MSVYKILTQLPPSSDSIFHGISGVDDGFMHMCSPSQIKGVLDRFFESASTIYILEIDASRLATKLKWEGPAPLGTAPASDSKSELFPHLYGSLNLSQDVVKTHHISRDPSTRNWDLSSMMLK